MNINGLNIQYHVSQTKDDYGLIIKKYPCGKKANLKKGDRKGLKRTNLTAFARKQILASGRLFSWKYKNEKTFLSPTFITLTYGAEVPDHQTAKKHLQKYLEILQKKGYGKYYTWVAQMQTGSRAREKGRVSFREQHGAAIHFHILTEHIPAPIAQVEMCYVWKRIVNTWAISQLEKQFTFIKGIQDYYGSYTLGIKQFKQLHYDKKIAVLNKQKIPFSEVKSEYGYDAMQVYNAAHYMSKYISMNKDEILGNMWNMSKSMRELIKTETKTVVLNEIDYIDFCKKHSQTFYSKKQTNGKIKKLTIPETVTNTMKKESSDIKLNFCEDFQGNTMIFCNKISVIIADIKRMEENRKIINRNIERRKYKLFPILVNS